MDRPRGINVIGYLQGELGLGEIARKLVAAAEAAQIPTATVTYRRLHARQQHGFEERGRGEARYDTNVICVNADELPGLYVDLGPNILAGRYTIGVWFWEIAHFPASLHSSFDLVDEVWTASRFVREAVAAETGKPVRVVPVPLYPPPPARLDRIRLDLPDDYLFLFIFDYFSVNARKNPIGLVEAFKCAFDDGEGPLLVLKSINGDRRRDALARLHRAVGGRTDIRVVDGYVSTEEKDSMMAACDCYVSLHRSEGLGLTMAEAMALGKPVIATGYSGNLEFMNDANSYLVRHTMTITPPGADPYMPGVEWAEPDLDHAAELMRHVYDHPEETRVVGERARKDLQEHHAMERTADFLRARLDEIPDRDRVLLAIREPLDHAAAAAAEVPGGALASSSGGVTAPARRFLARVLWPELKAQRQLDTSTIESMRRLLRFSRRIMDRLDALEQQNTELARRIEELAKLLGARANDVPRD